ncbi:hypothetical protein [Nocardia harenae]|uniref:hypothetical protein n=1 Tax=Nocardia harenae TaxID=358707 RepID=UPI000829BD76|nr:hypothetical protein [Nocardia harenae]
MVTTESKAVAGEPVGSTGVAAESAAGDSAFSTVVTGASALRAESADGATSVDSDPLPPCCEESFLQNNNAAIARLVTPRGAFLPVDIE